MYHNSCLYKHTPKTFRRASQKILQFWGSNMQNWEKSLRQIYRPDGFSSALEEKCKYWLETGDATVFTEEELVFVRVFCQSDQSGAEALIVAYECDPLDYRQLFINSIKPHVYVALKLFKDIWTRKLKESGGLVEDFNIEELCDAAIPELKKNPFWKDIDSLIKSSDNWSAQERYYYLAKQTCHCLDDKTEVLTDDGWVGIATLHPNQRAAIWDGNNIIMERPSRVSFLYYGELLHFQGEEVDQLVTPNHKMVYWQNNKINIAEAQCVFNNNRLNIPTGGHYIGGSVNLPDWEVKLLVAIQADGHLESENRVVFNFVKERKIDRLHTILKEGGLESSFNTLRGVTTAGNVVSQIGVMCPKTIALFRGANQWGSWLLTLSKRNLETLVNELSFWDGTYTESYQHKREEYCSSIKENIDWIKTICHLVNKQGTVGESQAGCVKLGINNRKRSIVKWKSRKQHIGFVHCLQVSTGMFLIRRNGKISITHNSANYGIESQTFRMNILEKSEGVIYLENKVAAEFLMTYRSLFPEIPERCRRIEQQALKTRTLFNLFGHPFHVTDFRIDDKLKELYAWSAQSTVGEITRTAITQMQEYIESEGKPWDQLADTHDSYMLQFPLLHAVEGGKKMKELMNIELTSPNDGVKFKMKSEQNWGFTWNSAKKTNPLGLQELKWI